MKICVFFQGRKLNHSSNSGHINPYEVSWPSGLVYWTQVLVLSEYGFKSRPGRSWRLCP